ARTVTGVQTCALPILAAGPAMPLAGPAFASSVSAVSAADLGATWHSGCPVGPAQLRLLRLTYWGFDGQAHAGTLVVNASVASARSEERRVGEECRGRR